MYSGNPVADAAGYYHKDIPADDFETIKRCEFCLGTTAQWVEAYGVVLCVSCNTIENIETLKEE